MNFAMIEKWIKLMLIAALCILVNPHSQAQSRQDSVTKANQTNPLSGQPNQAVGTELVDTLRVDSTENAIRKINQKIGNTEVELEKANSLGKKPEQEVRHKISEQKDVQETKRAVDIIDQQTQLSQQAGVSAPNLPSLTPETGLNTSLPKLSVPDAKLTELNFVSSKGIEEFKSLPSGVAGLSTQFGAYQKDLQLLQRGNINEMKAVPEAIEGRAEQVAKLEELSHQSPTVETLPGQLVDTDYLQQQAKAKLIEKSVDHFVGQDKTVQQARKLLDQSKGKYSQVQTEQGKFVRATSLKGTPWIERFLPGIRLQIYQGPPTSFDLFPFISYRFTTRWSAGVSGSYRLSFDRNRRAIWQRPVYGGQLYGECKFYKSFLLHAQFERYSVNFPTQASAGEQSRTSVNGMLIGAGKQYGITKRVRGNILFLRSILHSNNKVYSNKWNIRMSFYWITKQKVNTEEP